MLLNLSTQLRLKNFLVAVAKQEQEIESLRLAMARSIDCFEPYSVYRIFDTVKKGQIVADDIRFFCM